MKDHNYSIDSLIEKIHNSKTREYFEEVTQTFYSGSYRSCLVTLYSVVICDLIFKLEELSEVYSDETARKILVEISKKQKENPKSPDWETNILELVRERTSLLELYEIEAIYQLQKQRHLSAHPVLSESSILYTPNRETITAHITNMLTSVLTKPAIFSKKMADTIFNDIGENRDRLIIFSDLERYLEAKYFRNAKQELFNNLFKKLWKFIFKLDNADCTANREINLSTLRIIYNKDRSEIERFIRNEQSFFDFSNEAEIVNHFILLLFDYPKMYECLSEATQTLVDSEIANNQDFKFISWFKYKDFETYFGEAASMISEDFCPSMKYFSKFLLLSQQFDKKKESLDLAVEVFGSSYSYAIADKRFSDLIEPFINDFDENQLVLIISKIEGNRQIYQRSAASSDNTLVSEALIKTQPKFDFESYPHFKSKLLLPIV